MARSLLVRLESIGIGKVVRGPLARSLQLLVVGLAIGAADDLQVRYWDIAKFGPATETLYQACFMTAAAAGSYAVLRGKGWTPGRRLSTLLMAIPVATVADNVSIDLGTLKPYFIVIPAQGYDWRGEVFAHTPLLNYVSQLVNQQTLGPGILDGYVAAIAAVACYVALQRALDRRAALIAVAESPMARPMG